jgi:hypothetical protein
MMRAFAGVLTFVPTAVIFPFSMTRLPPVIVAPETGMIFPFLMTIAPCPNTSPENRAKRPRTRTVETMAGRFIGPLL